MTSISSERKWGVNQEATDETKSPALIVFVWRGIDWVIKLAQSALERRNRR